MILKIKWILFISFIYNVNVIGQFAWNQLSLTESPSPLDIRVGDRSDIQIWRNASSTGQLYSPSGASNGSCGSCWDMYNGIFMTANSRTFVTWNWALDGYNDEWIGFVAAVTGTGTSSDPWIISAKHENSSNGRFGFQIDYIYINGTEYIDVELTPYVPNNNTRDIKIYHIMDTYLSGSDAGPAYTSGTDPYDLIGVLAADGSIFEAFVVTEDPWDRYGSHFYYDLINEPYHDGELSNTLDTDPTTDNAIGVQWSLGVVQGTQPTIKYRIGFTEDIGSIIGCEKAYMNRHLGRMVKASGG